MEERREIEFVPGFWLGYLQFHHEKKTTMKAVGENWWTGFQTVGSGNFLGVLLLAQFVAILVDFFVFSNTNHIFAFLLASELHIFGLVLLYDLEYDVSDSHDRNNNKDSYRSHRDYTPPPVGTILVESGEGEGSTISNVTSYSDDMSHSSKAYDSHYKVGKRSDNYDENKDGSDYTSMASISTMEHSSSNSEDDNYDHNRSLECCCGFSISYAGFFTLLHTLSALLLLASLNQQIYELNLSSGLVPVEWARTLFLLSYATFLAWTTLSYYKRYLEPAFDHPILRNVRVKQSLSVLVAFISLGIFGNAMRVRNRATQQLNPFFYGVSRDDKVSPQPYVGEAWVSGASIIDDDAVCENYYDSIPINVTVAYGGDWACPENPNQQCEATISSQVECSFYESLLRPEQEDDVDDNLNGVTVEEYIYFRYHDYQVDDDNLYDFNEIPSFSHWNRPTDTIIGTCDGSCTARSELWKSENYWSYARSNHVMHLSLGLGLCFLGWPLLEWWQEYRGRSG